LTKHPEWEADLANFQIEAAWVVGDWHSVRDIVGSGASGSEISMARVLLGIHDRDHEALSDNMRQARRELGVAITASSRQYSRAYPAILQLHMLHEIGMVCDVGLDIAKAYALRTPDQNKDELVRHKVNQLRRNLSNRLDITLPSFRIRESILSIRRTAYAESPSNNALMKAEVGAAWIASAKIARKAGHEQTAYSATLQAKLAMAPNVVFQQTKILKATGHPLKALNELENGIANLKRQQISGSRSAPIVINGQDLDAQGPNVNLETAKVSRVLASVRMHLLTGPVPAIVRPSSSVHDGRMKQGDMIRMRSSLGSKKQKPLHRSTLGSFYLDKSFDS
jgi:serine/threonine-protein kinase ATR